MKRFSILTLVLTLIAATAIAAPRGARRGSERPGPGGPRAERTPGQVLTPEQLSEFLGLTDAQIAQVGRLRESMRTTIEPLYQQKRANQEEMRAAVDAGDAPKAGELLIANHELDLQIKAAHDAFKTSFEALLNAEQQAKYAVYEEIIHLRRERTAEED